MAGSRQSKSKVAAKAKSHRAQAKASAAQPGRSRRPQTVAQRAAQKIRENFKSLSEQSSYVRVYPATGRTLYQQLMVDIEARDGGCSSVIFGGRYYESMSTRYSDEDSFFGMLKPDAEDDSAPNADLLEVERISFSLILCLI